MNQSRPNFQQVPRHNNGGFRPQRPRFSGPNRSEGSRSTFQGPVEVKYTLAERTEYRFTGQDVIDTVLRLNRDRGIETDLRKVERAMWSRHIHVSTKLTMPELNEAVDAAIYFGWMI